MTVRNEVVRLSLDDAFTSGMAKVAAVTALASGALHELDGNSVNAGSSLRSAERDVDSFSNTAAKGGADIDRYSGRLRLVADAALILGPALGPLGAGAIAGVAGLTAEVGALAGALGVGILAFHGLGDGLKALDAYHLDPTAENLAKVRQELDKLGPSGATFVQFLDDIEPRLRTLQMAARNGLLPGLEQGIGDALTQLPEVRSLIRDMSTGLGDLAAEGGAAIKGGQLSEFFDYLKSDAEPTMEATVKTLANLAGGIAHLIVAAAPLSRDFTAGLLEDSRAFERWASTVRQTQGYADFIQYVEQTGPQAADTLGAIANAMLQIVEAASPLGGPVLHGLEDVANIVSAVADSDLGTPIFTGLAALSLYNRALAVTAKVSESAAAGQRGLGAMIGGNIKAQTDGVKGLPAAYREATAAQQALTAAEVEYRDATIGYNSSLRLRNRLMAEGYLTGEVGIGSERRLADSLGRVEMATYGVQTATERVNIAEESRSRLVRSTAAEAGKAAALVGGLALATSGAADGIGLTNTASLALIGTMAGPWGTAIGAGVGAVMDATAANDALDDSFKRLQANLPTFASSNADIASFTSQLDQAQQAVDDFSARMDAVEQRKNPLDQLTHLGDQLAGLKNFTEGVFGQSDVEEAQSKINSYKEWIGVVELLRTVTGKTAAAQAQDFDQMSLSADAYTTSLEDNIQAMRDERAESLKGINAHLDYRSSLLDAADALKENGKTVDANTRAGEANLRSLYAMPAAWNAQSDAAKNAKGSLAAARQAFITTATAMGMSEDKAKALAKQLYEIPTKVETRIDANTSVADLKVKALKQELNSIDRNIDIYTHLHIERLPSASGFGPQAAGGVATGGHILGPGTKTSDSILARLSNGEFVMKAAAVDKYGVAMMHRINAMAFAGGGPVNTADGITRGAMQSYMTDQSLLLHNAQAQQIRDTMFVGGSLQLLKSEIDSTKTEYQSAKDALTSLRQAMADFSAQVADKFSVDLSQSNGVVAQDLIDQGLSGDVAVQAAAAANTGTLSNQINSATQAALSLPAIIAVLKRAGLKGPALQQVIDQMSITQLQTLASNPSQAGQLGASLTGLYAAQHTAGAAASQAVFGAQERVAEKRLSQVHQELVTLNTAVKGLQAEQKNTTAAAGKTGPDRTAQGVATALNGVGRTATQSRNRGKG